MSDTAPDTSPSASPGVRARVSALWERIQRWPLVAYIIALVDHHQRRNGAEMAASITLQAALALVPLAILGLATTRELLGNIPRELPTTVADDQTPVRTATVLLDAFLPGLSEKLLPIITTAAPATGFAALTAAVAALALGLSWVRTVRRAVRVMNDQPTGPTNVLVEKSQDLLTLVMTVSAVAAMGALAVLGRAALLLVLEPGPGLDTAFSVGTQLLGALTALLVAATLLRFTALPGSYTRSQLWSAAVWITVGVELAKFAFMVYAGFTESRNGALYGTFALLAGLVIWIAIVARVFVAGAAHAGLTHQREHARAENVSPDPV